jgi:hypothetical protein
MATSFGALWRQTGQVLRARMQPAVLDVAKPRVVYNLADPADAAQWVCSTDAVIGGRSLATVAHSADAGHLVFKGELSTEVPSANPKVQRSGYCLLRSKLLPVRPLLLCAFG